jgi:hypothetical protein
MKDYIQNIEEIYLDKIYSFVNDRLPEFGGLILSYHDQYQLQDIIKEYHKSKLELLNKTNMKNIEEIKEKIKYLEGVIKEYEKEIEESTDEDEIDLISDDIFNVESQIDLLEWVIES